MPDAIRSDAVIPDYDRDSIHTLPLSVIPVGNQALKRARLIKNVRLETRVELFREEGIGSGQISIDEVPDFFGGETEELSGDMDLLRRVGSLPAFDPYTLRIGLRQAGVEILNVQALQLSSAKKRELFPLMCDITRPLIAHLYGGGSVDPDNLERLIEMVARPDTPKVRNRILGLSRALEVSMDQVPDMLETYGDRFMALSYYRGYFKYALPAVDRLLEWMDEVRENSFLRNDQTAQKALKQTDEVLSHVTGSVKRRFEGFDRNTVVRWENVTVGTFKAVQDLIARHQASLAEVLCGLTVKIYEWEQRFPSGGGSPDKRAEFVTGELRPGLDRLWAVERRAPTFGDPDDAFEA